MTSAEFRGVTRPARFPTTRPAHARRGRRRSVAATTCSRRGARSPSSCRPQGSRRGGWQSSRTAAGRGDVGGIRRVTRPARFPTTRPAHARRGRRRSVVATTGSRRGARSLSSCRLESRRGGLESSRTAAGRGGVGGIRRGHETRAFSDDGTSARTTRSAALGRSSDVLAARRSLAAVVSAREPARWLRRAAERPQGAVTSAEFRGVTRPARFPTTRPVHARRGRRRSVTATTCSRRGARSPSPCGGSREGGRVPSSVATAHKEHVTPTRNT